MNAKASSVMASAVLVLFLVLPFARADFQCIPTDIQIEFLDVQPYYSLDKDFIITAKVYNVNPNYPVKAELRDSGGYLLQSVDGWAQGDNTWKFTFAGLQQAGSYTVKTWLQHPAPPHTIISKSADIVIKPGLLVTFGIPSYTQYLGEDVVAKLEVQPHDRPIIKTLSAKLNGFPINPLPRYVDTGGGTWDVIVSGDAITTYGTLDLTITVEDVAGEYETKEKSLTGITIAQSNFQVLLDVPQSASVGDIYDIKLSTLRNNKPYEADRVELRITYPGGGPGKLIQTHDFSHVTGSNEYSYSFKFEYGQQHYFKASAWSAYESDSVEKNVPVSGGAVCGCDETVGTCQAACTCDPDCETAPTFNIWLIIGIVTVVLIITIGILVFK
jgi:hypothetical protein